MLHNSLVVIDVGQGNAALLSHGDKCALIDAGPGSAVLEFVREHGVKRLDLIIISHADKDHIGGVIGLLAAGIVEIGTVYVNTDSEKGSRNWAAMLKALEDARRSKGIEFRVGITQDLTVELRRLGFPLTVLGPTALVAARGPGQTDARGRKLTTNSVSAVIAIDANDRRFAVLSGDVDEVGLANIVESGVDLRAPVLVFPHHGGKPGRGKAGSFATKLAELVGAATVLFSVGRGSFGHPDPEVIQAVKTHRRGTRIACTQLNQRCAAKLPASGAHLLPLFAMGREKQTCCGGTFQLDIGTAPGEPAPSRAHADFVRSAVPTPMCLDTADL